MKIRLDLWNFLKEFFLISGKKSIIPTIKINDKKTPIHELFVVEAIKYDKEIAKQNV